MNVGSIGYATNSGLGVLLKDFYDHGVVNRIIVVPHPKYRNHNWFRLEDDYSYREGEFLKNLDCLLLFENAFDMWPLVKKAKNRGIRVVMMPMYEYTPFPLPVPADFYVCPSELDLNYYSQFPSRFVPVPVTMPWKLRSRAKVFVHNAGHGGHGFRNGTPELLQAVKYIKSPIELIIRYQPDSNKMCDLLNRFEGDSRVRVEQEVPSDELYNAGDVFLFPEKFNGLSLPLQEAYASGMLVMATNRFPMNTWLPKAPLIPSTESVPMRIATKFNKAVVCPRAIAATIDNWYDRDIEEYSRNGLEWAQQTSWSVLKPQYIRVLAGEL